MSQPISPRVPFLVPPGATIPVSSSPGQPSNSEEEAGSGSAAAPLESKRDSSPDEDSAPGAAAVHQGSLPRSLPPFHLYPLATSNETLAAQCQQVERVLQAGETDSDLPSSGGATPPPGSPRGGQEDPAPR